MSLGIILKRLLGSLGDTFKYARPFNYFNKLILLMQNGLVYWKIKWI